MRSWKWPAVILLADALGSRPVYEAMAGRLVAAGYGKLLELFGRTLRV